MTETINVYVDEGCDGAAFIQAVQNPEVEIRVPRPVRGFDALGPQVVIAGISALSAIAGGLISYLSTRRSATVTIEGENWKIVVPAGLPESEVKKLVAMAQERQSVSLIRVGEIR